MILTPEGCRTRQQRLWNSVPDDVEWLLVADPRHLQYLVNFSVHPLSFSGGERGLLLLEREAGTTLFVDNFAMRSAAGPHYADHEVIETWYDKEHSIINRDHALQAAVKTVEERLFARKGIIEAEWLPLAVWDLLGLDRERHRADMEADSLSIGHPPDDGTTVDLGTLIRMLRREKQPDEIALLRRCMQAGDAGHARARELIRPGITELELYREIQSAAVAAAGEACLVYGDFRAVNATAPKAGGLPTKYELQNGDLLIIDYSVVLNGYRSDFTNTYAVGKPTADQQRLFDICCEAMQAGEAVLQAGTKAAAVHAAVAGPIEQAGYGPLKNHAGHGIGLAHPEKPILVAQSDDLLLAGDVVTIEPGLYIDGIGGIRIEHNYLITETAYERLSSHTISLT